MHESDKETQLQQALQSENPVTDLPLAVEVDYFRLAKDKYFVPVTVRMPGSALSFGEGVQACHRYSISSRKCAMPKAAPPIRFAIPFL